MSMDKQHIRGVHHIALRVPDFDRALAFYTEALGLVPGVHWGEPGHRVQMLSLGQGACIELFEGGTQNTQENPDEYGAWFHLALRTSDVDAVFSRAIVFGAREKIAPKDVVLGTGQSISARIAFVYGLFGEVIEFFDEKE